MHCQGYSESVARGPPPGAESPEYGLPARGKKNNMIDAWLNARLVIIQAVKRCD